MHAKLAVQMACVRARRPFRYVELLLDVRQAAPLEQQVKDLALTFCQFALFDDALDALLLLGPLIGSGALPASLEHEE